MDIFSPKAQELLGNPALATIQVPDEVSNSLNKDFYTLESALQNPEIISKARAEGLNGIDTHLETIWEAKGFDAETIAKLKSDKKTSAKISKTLELLEEKSKEAFKATGKEKQDLVNEINALQTKAIEDNKKFLADLDTEKSQRKLDKTNWELDGVYNGFDYVLPTEKPISVHAAKSIIAKASADKGVVFELGENGVTLKTTSGTEFVQDNVKLTPKDFITKTLIENKFIKVNGKQNQQNNQQQHQNNQNIHQQNNDNKKPESAYMKSLKKDIEANPLPTNVQ